MHRVGEEGVTVRVMQSSACNACAAARMCRSGENRERLIDVATPHAADFRSGEAVVLTATMQQSRAALVLAYVLPLALMLIVLFSVHGFSGDDGLAALVSLLFVMLYYVLLYVFRSRLSRSFRFDVSADAAPRVIDNN